MNWEPSVLNRIYKSSDFKINIISLSNIKEKSKYIEKLHNLIEKYNLQNFNLKVSKGGALYKKKEKE